MSVARVPSTAIPDNAAATLIADLRNIVGKQHTLTDDAATRRYRTGFRFGAGKALAVLRPGTIVEQWQVL
jgi:D-lactate dehydrogenase